MKSEERKEQSQNKPADLILPFIKNIKKKTNTTIHYSHQQIFNYPRKETGERKERSNIKSADLHIPFIKPS